MALDVSTPDPPDLSPAVDPEEYEDAELGGPANEYDAARDEADPNDYRRAEIADALAAGAWDEAFGRWAATASVDESAWRVVEDLDLVSEFDFFWDGFAGRIGYHAPGVPEDWKEREYHPEIESWATVSAINAGLTELGQTVCDVIQEEYVDWEQDYEAPEDLPDF
jgi:hypothetical protein